MYVLTTRSAANVATSGSSSDSDQPAYLLVVAGHFTDTTGFGPADSAPTTGSVLTLVVDAASYQVQDFGLGDQQPRLTLSLQSRLVTIENT
jgi:hypothetical protein